MKYQLLSLMIMLFIGTTTGQNEPKNIIKKDFAEGITWRVCEELADTEASQQLYLERIEDLIQNDKFFKTQYEKGMSIFGEIPEFEEKCNKYIQWVLRRDCENYRTVFDEQDQAYENDSSIRKAYLTSKKVLYALIDHDHPDDILGYFNVKDNVILKAHLEQMIAGVAKTKRRMYLSIGKLETEEILFCCKLENYVSGGTELMLYLEFDLKGEKIVAYHYNEGKIVIRYPEIR